MKGILFKMINRASRSAIGVTAVLTLFLLFTTEVRSQPMSADSEVPPASYPELYPDLGRQLAPIMDSIARAREALRQDSATVAADSSFIRFRQELADLIKEVMEEFSDPEFRADIWPGGAHAMARWRQEGRVERRPTEEEKARADSIKAVLGSHGVWAYHAEGDTYFSADEEMLRVKLGPYLTPGMRAFQKMQVDAQRRPVAEDAALMIPLDELSRRIIRGERYLADYPESPVRDVVESRYRWYLAVYLAGLDNTPAFDWQTRELHPEWRENLERYAAEHPGYESADVVSRFLELLEGSDFRRSPEIEAFLSDLWSKVVLVQFP